MVFHLVLLEPKPDLTAIERAEFIRALDVALREIPSIRRADFGRRLRLGAAYETAVKGTFEYFAVLAFEDVEGLRAYLEHPAHRELGARFKAAAARMKVFDYETDPAVAGPQTRG